MAMSPADMTLAYSIKNMLDQMSELKFITYQSFLQTETPDVPQYTPIHSLVCCLIFRWHPYPISIIILTTSKASNDQNVKMNIFSLIAPEIAILQPVTKQTSKRRYNRFNVRMSLSSIPHGV